MFYKVSDLVIKSIKRSGAADSLQAVWVLRFWPEVAAEVFGKDKEVKALKAVSIKSGKLYILVPSTTWASEVRLKSKDIINSFAQKTGKKFVFSVATKIKS